MSILIEHVAIESDRELVWSVLADFGDVAAWAPYMRVSHLIGSRETGIGTRRAMRHQFGFRFEECVTAWNEGTGFEFDVLKAPWPMKDVSESWTLQTQGSRCLVTSRVEYGMKMGVMGALLDWLLVRFVVRREMRSGMRGLKSHVEHTNGRN